MASFHFHYSLSFVHLTNFGQIEIHSESIKYVDSKKIAITGNRRPDLGVSHQVWRIDIDINWPSEPAVSRYDGGPPADYLLSEHRVKLLIAFEAKPLLVLLGKVLILTD